MKVREKWSGYRKLLAAFFLGICCVLAGKTAVSAKTAPQLVSCVSSGGSQMILNAVLTDGYGGTYQIYRSTSADGAYKLVDSFYESGCSWSSSGGDWQTTGSSQKVTAYCEDADFAGSMYFLDTGLTLGQTYYYKICYITYTRETLYSEIKSGTVALDAPEIVKCYASSNSSVKLSWTKSSKAQGYQIYRRVGKKWKKIKTISKASKVSYTDTGLKASKTYKYKVRAYRTVNGKKVYSSFSQVCKASTKSPTVKGNYSSGSVYGPSLSTSKLAEVKRVVQGFKTNYIKSGMSDYEKVWTAFCYIRANCSYARKGWQYNGANTAWGALVYGEAQCSGFARGMKALCDAIGVSCRYVHTSSNSSSHQWNMVKIGGKWYILDAQGGFFLVGSTYWLSFTGLTWNTKGFPTCSKQNHANACLVSSIN